MYLIICIGVIAGLAVFSTDSVILAGGIAGGVIGYLVAKVLHLEKKIIELDQFLTQDVPTAETSVVSHEAAIAEPSSFDETTIDEQTELSFEIEPEQSMVATKQPAPDRQVVDSTVIAEEKNHLIDLWEIVVSYFTGGNVVVRAGIIILFFGVAFLFKYTAERNIVPIEFRLLGVCLGAIAILIIGWRLRNTRTTYAIILQGGGVGVLYLTIFAALRLYELLPAGIALILLIFLSIFSATLAILQDARALSVIGISGGFLAPVLTSTGGGSHAVLFSYYTLLNAGIFFTAWHKSWRELNLLGFIFTFGIGSAWGVQNYRPEMFLTTEPFLIIFFLYYLTIGVLFAKNQPLRHKGYIDGTLVFGTPIVCFTLQTVLIKPYEYGIACSALVMGGLYATLAWMIFKKGSEAMRTLIETFLATGVIFGTVAIPLALDGRWTSAAWALEGAAIIWVGIRQERWMARIFGLLLQLFAGLAFFSALKEPAAGVAVFNGIYLGCVAVALGGFFSSYCLYGNQDKIPTAQTESLMALGWALLWWFGAGIHEIDNFASRHYEPALILSFCSISCAIFFLTSAKLAWHPLKHVYKALPAVMVLFAVYSLARFSSHPAVYGGYVAWPLAFVILYRLLYQDDKNFSDVMPYLHIGAFLLFVGLITWEISWWTDFWVNGSGVWRLIALGLVPAAFVYGLSKFHYSLPWPVEEHSKLYVYETLMPIVIYLIVGSLFVNLTNSGNPWPLIYLPLLNPLDLTLLFVFISIALWLFVLVVHLEIDAFSRQINEIYVAGGALIFFWLNAMLIRTIHHWGGVDFHARSLIKVLKKSIKYSTKTVG